MSPGNTWSRPLSRRHLFRAGGSGLFAAGVGTVLSASGAAAAVPHDQARFDLSRPAHELFRAVTLNETCRAMQGMAFDTVNKHLFIVQAINGSSGDDLCINRLNTSWEVTGFMHVQNVGHGVSIGVEAVGADSYIWMESRSDADSSAGRGTALARFKFVSNSAPSAVRTFLARSRTITCATDPVNRRLLVRRAEGGAMHYSLYRLNEASVGCFRNRLAHFAEPRLGSAAVTFQGYAVLGKYLYTLDGTGHENPDDADSYLSTIDMRTGRIVQRCLSRAGESLVYREPEAMAIDVVDGAPRLCFGFASHSTANSARRYANVFYQG